MQQTSGSGSNKISRNATQCNAMQANATQCRPMQTSANKRKTMQANATQSIPENPFVVNRKKRISIPLFFLKFSQADINASPESPRVLTSAHARLIGGRGLKAARELDYIIYKTPPKKLDALRGLTGTAPIYYCLVIVWYR